MSAELQSTKWKPFYIFYIRKATYENWGFLQPLEEKRAKLGVATEELILKHGSSGSQTSSLTLMEFARISGKCLPSDSVCSSESTWFSRTFWQATVISWHPNISGCNHPHQWWLLSSFCILNLVKCEARAILCEEVLGKAGWLFPYNTKET